MIDLPTAISIAKKHLKETCDATGVAVVLIEKPLLERNFGWAFSYNSVEYMETGAFLSQLAGNAPIIVDRISGKVSVTGTAYSIHYYVNNYILTGNPHSELGRRVMIQGWDVGANKISATKAVRKYTEFGLAASKGAIDECLEGGEPIVEAKDKEVSQNLVGELSMAGFIAKRLPD